MYICGGPALADVNRRRRRFSRQAAYSRADKVRGAPLGLLPAFWMKAGVYRGEFWRSSRTDHARPPVFIFDRGAGKPRADGGVDAG